MTADDNPRILLLGAGHANLLAARGLRAALPGAAITLIDAADQATYSGMVPGHVAGHYHAADIRVDLQDFAARHAIAFLRARIVGVDPATRQVALQDGPTLPYDLAALDVGSHSAMPDIPGFASHAIPIKPLDGFAARLRQTDPASPALIIGGGVAGAEIALALHHRGARQVTVLEAGPVIAPALGPRARRHLSVALDRAAIRIVTHAQIAAVEGSAVILRDGRRIASALTVGIAGARAHAWMALTLPVDGAGFVRVTPTLQVEGWPTLFAAGDCAAMMHAPRPKAGVFAVRQAPVLAANLIASSAGRPLRRHDPQEDYLKLISLGGRCALAEWRGLTLRGMWLWRLKDRIDRRFMASLGHGARSVPPGGTVP
ncbi:FAD-dependent oxidoreductase [Paracoccus nototheniae]|uniref:FAD-dependent oxidoreductase n=1 Tax=Paracoccus nototheniae TaxID=2489002 RepID=A0ABW4DYD9_9RHOB|nr:FAD-dependent oxidoreductase [Paracoccus nototheniae]